mgnify:CR=1 FL=1
MENKSHAFIAGLFTVLLAGAILAIVWFMNRDTTVYVPYQVVTDQSVSGLSNQAKVRFKGIDVGRVTSIEFSREEPGQIVIGIEVSEEAPMTATTFATLSYQGVTGIASVELNDRAVNGERLQSSRAHPAKIPMRPGLLDELQIRGLAILDQVQTITTGLAAIIDDKNSKEIVDTISHINKAAKGWERIPHIVDPGVKEFPAAVRDGHQMFVAVTELSEDLKGIVKKANAMMNKGMQSDAMPRLEALARDARVTLQNINSLLEQYKQRPSGLLFGAKGPAPGPGEKGFTGQ